MSFNAICFSHCSSGDKLQKIAVGNGVRKITSCQFGGPDLDELYVTSARNDNIKEDEDDDSGSLYKVPS